MPLGALLDQWEVYRQATGLMKNKSEGNIEQVIPNNA